MSYHLEGTVRESDGKTLIQITGRDQTISVLEEELRAVTQICDALLTTYQEEGQPYIQARQALMGAESDDDLSTLGRKYSDERMAIVDCVVQKTEDLCLGFPRYHIRGLFAEDIGAQIMQPESGMQYILDLEGPEEFELTDFSGLKGKTCFSIHDYDEAPQITVPYSQIKDFLEK
jgi:hypothetical protein